MSRTIEQIEAAIIADVQTEPALNDISSNTSRRAIWRLLCFVMASAVLLLEQIIDVFKAENEIKINSATPATEQWLTDRVFKFQYSATTPQVIQLVDLAPVYPLIDPTLRIVTRCSVVTTLSNTVNIKTSKNEPPVALSPTELASLQSYINVIGVPGVFYNCSSGEADRVYIDANIYYSGQYSTVIEGTVTNAINTFLANLPFNGQFKISDLELTIRSVIGVTDVLVNNVKIRANSTAFASGTFLVQNKTTISRLFNTIAGYVILEDTVANNLNFIAS